MSFEYTLAAIDRDIRYRKKILYAAIEEGCYHLPSMARNRDEIAELEQIRANLEAIQGRVK
jgi:hypothetical protein